ncbi:MAG TPA: AMP-binding protein [Rhizomicrobium sp.]|jgi:acyl-[acyl-carrier-protein]-phospholipid O-acyltransferase/long-chain-fatty-acid--[acyl-carrier-protein] ligase
MASAPKTNPSGRPTRQPFDPANTQGTIFQAFLGARAEFGGKTPALVDVDGRVLNYNELARASFALGHALKRGTARGENIGILLPTGAGAAIAFLALSAFGRVPTMLNFTSGPADLQSAIRTAQIRRVVTARRFIELGKLETAAAAIGKVAELVFLEDVRAKISISDKLTALAGGIVPGLVAHTPGKDKPAAILFTSGTEGQPKGVALSHENIVSNIAQVRAHIDLYDDDVLFNPLPAFHCFGLTVGLLLPLVAGVKVICHPTPLQPHEIVRRIRDMGATILLSTDTFITQYARAGESGDLNSLRLAVCGAERVRDETRALFRRKYGMEILEGYGVTEASPVVAANQIEANRPGTVGRLMAGMESRLDPVEGIPNAGLLVVKGPNIMLGYIKPDAPGVIVPPQDGWYDTGDVVSIDEDGFIAIRGRVKRFAKIGGETVSLAVAENVVAAAWPDHHHAAVAVKDRAKGEQIVLVTDKADAKRLDLVAWAQNHGVSELAIPRRIVTVEALPVLGTGKTDYVRVQALAEQENPSLA